MKLSKPILAIIVVVFLALYLQPSALASEPTQEQEDASGASELVENIGDEASELLGDTQATSAGAESLTTVLKSIGNAIPDLLRSAVKSGVIVLLVAVFCGLADTIWDLSSQNGLSAGSLAAIAAISAAVLGTGGGFVSAGNEALSQLDDFSKTLLPTMSALAACSGAVTSAAAKYAATSLFMDILITLSRTVIFPVIYAYAASIIAEAAFGGEALSAASSLLKWLAVTLMTAVVLAFIFYLGITGVVTGSSDAAAIRLTKTTLASTLPVVGGIVSDAAASVLSATSVLKNSVGVFGIVAVTAICALPFLRLAMHFLIYKAASKISVGFCGQKLGRLLNGFANCFGMVTGMTGACALMLYFSLMSLIKVVN